MVQSKQVSEPNDEMDDPSDGCCCCIKSSCRESECGLSRMSSAKISWSVYFVVCLFGIGSWLAINGIWMELPILVDRLPEKWSLPSYLTVTTELANTGPLLYFIGNKLAPRKIHERTAVYLIMVLGSTACVTLAFFWDRTSYIIGAERSTALIILSFFVALVDCTSTVTFLPFMAIFPEIYMSALFFGENMSSLLPSFVALIQGIDKRKTVTKTACLNSTCHNTTMTVFTGLKFGPDYFFFFLALMMVTCGVAFTLLNFAPFLKKHHVMDYSECCKLDRKQKAKNAVMREEDNEAANQALLDSNSLLATEQHDFSSEVSLASFPGSLKNHTVVQKGKNSEKSVLIYLFLLQTWINCISNGAITQIQAFACEPYGPTAYHLAATLSGIASALVCILFVWLSTRSTKIITVCCFLYTIISAYIILLAAQSPTPLLKGSNIGSTLVVLAFILSAIFVNYAKLAICTIFREKGRRELFWCGVAIQIGSFVGAIVVFPLVNIVKLFKQ